MVFGGAVGNVLGVGRAMAGWSVATEAQAFR
jgi:hypothetical protein